MMEYNGFVGYVTLDQEGKCFFGEVIGLNDGITFKGRTPEELEQALKDSVEVYLEWCGERGVEPEKTFSGKLRHTMKPRLHKKLSLIAAEKEISLNRLINEALAKACDPDETEEKDDELVEENIAIAVPA